MHIPERPVSTQYLYLVGILQPDNRLQLLPTFLTTDPQGVLEDMASPLSAELYDADENLLLRFCIPVGAYCAPRTRLAARPVQGKIPFHPATRFIRFYRDELVIHEIQVGESEPSIELTWVAGPTMRGKQTIAWEASHPESKPMLFFLRYSYNDGVTWQPASFPTNNNQQEIDLDRFPGGKHCRIMVVATDSVRTSTAESRPFALPVKSCRTMILGPQDGAEFAAGQSVVFHGQGYYIEERRQELESLRWSSSQDGELGRGGMMEAKYLSPGFHQISLRGGTGTRVGEAMISITIGGEAEQPWAISSRS